MKKFEYKHISCALPSGIDGMMKEVEKLGKQGWDFMVTLWGQCRSLYA